MKKLFILTLFPLVTMGQSLKFENAESLSLKELKKMLKPQVVEVYNYSTRSLERYNAFSMNEVFESRYGPKKWKENSWVKVSTKDKYAPLIEMYKFLERKAYLAYERADSKPFTTIGSDRSIILSLAPFYLIWKENYRQGAAIRRDHWPYQITGFSFQQTPPKKLIPEEQARENIKWGYKNFVKQCIACHSIDGAGGIKGGELISNGITKSKSDLYLKKFISNPQKVRPGTSMSIFPRKIDMRKKRITDIVSYLRYMEKRAEANFRSSKVKSLDKLLNNSGK